MFLCVDNSVDIREENASEEGKNELGVEGLGQLLQTGDGESGKMAKRDFMLQAWLLPEESYLQSVAVCELLKVLAEESCELSSLNTESAGEKMKGLVGLHGEK